MMQLELVLKCCMHVLMIFSLCVWLKSVWNWKNGTYGCEFVGKFLQREGICFKLMRKELLQKDCMISVEKCKEKASMIAAVAEILDRIWDSALVQRIWDSALECGGMIHQMCASPHKANESPWKREEALPLL